MSHSVRKKNSVSLDIKLLAVSCKWDISWLLTILANYVAKRNIVEKHHRNISTHRSASIGGTEKDSNTAIQ